MFSPSNISPEALFNEGRAAFEAGQLLIAQTKFAQVAKIAPDNAPTQYFLGAVAMRGGDAKAAARHLERAVTLMPDNPDFWRALVDATAASAGRKSALRHVRRARGRRFPAAFMSELSAIAERDRSSGATSLGNAPKAEVDRVVGLFRAGDHAAALAAIGPLAAAHPDVAFVRNLAGVIHIQAGAPEEAVEHLLAASAADPGFVDPHSNLARAANDIGDHAAARAHAEAALKRAPAHFGARLNLGNALLGTGDKKAALRLFETLVAEQPESAEANEALGSALFEAEDFGRAIEVLNALKSHDPGNGAADVLLAKCEIAAGDRAAGMERLLAIAEADGDTGAMMYVAYLRLADGDPAGSAATAERVLALDPRSGLARLQISDATRWQAGDPRITEMAELFADAGDMPTEEFIALGFALAKAYRDTKDPAAEMASLALASKAKRAQFHYETEETRRDYENLRRTLTPEVFARLKDHPGNPDPTPIFVVGLPRAGSTLVEQIISAHPLVEGAGEIGAFQEAAVGLTQDDAGKFVPPGQITGAALDGVAAECLSLLRKRFPKAARITDKHLHSYLFVGLVFAALPNAKVVHVTRDPVDHCLSMYKNLFNTEGHRYTYDMAELGAYYAMYAAHMAYWRDLFPGRMIEVDYDMLVATPEPEIRKLIGALGLEWDVACLDHTKNTRTVTTLSYVQARQPISRASSRGGRRYGEALRPLLDALVDAGVIGAGHGKG